MTINACKCLRCGAPADTPIPFSGAFGSGEIPCCGPCAKEALDGYRKLQSDAAVLKEQGVHPKMIDRVMTLRVMRGDYDTRRSG